MIQQDYGTNCKDCERYGKLGDVCLIEHGKKFFWEFCRDFVPKVVLPDYKDLMRSVRQEQLLERKRLKEKKIREKRKKQKEKQEREALRKKERQARLRRLRYLKKKKMDVQKSKRRLGSEQDKKISRTISERRVEKEGQPGRKRVNTEKKTASKASHFEDSQNGIVRESDSIPGKGANVPDNQRQC